MHRGARILFGNFSINLCSFLIPRSDVLAIAISSHLLLEADTNESRDIVPEGKTLDYDGNLRKLEQLENPVVWHDPKTNKKTCIFCSEER